MWIVPALLFLFYAGLLSYAAAKDWDPLHRKAIQALALLLFFSAYFLTAWLIVSAGGPVFLSFPILIVGACCAFRFLGFLVGDWFERVHRAATGLEKITVAKSYDLAEKAEREHDFDGAVRLYREEGGRDPGDPEPWRRIAEIEMKRGRAEEAVPAFRRALVCLREPEAKVTTSFRLADVLGRLGHPDEARGVVEGVAREFPGTRFEEFAKERLKILAAPVDKTSG